MIIVSHCDLTWTSGINGGLLCDVQFRSNEYMPPFHYIYDVLSVMRLHVFLQNSYDVCRHSIIFSKRTRFAQGPEGSNLVIFKLPKYFTDEDLAKMFMPFGNLVAAKIIRSKRTTVSKGFGFVSYENPQSAEYAIRNTNGLLIGRKFLKVQLSQPKHPRDINWKWQYYKT